MAIEAKICGVNSLAAVEAAAKGGADLIGLISMRPRRAP
jgi:phosphoribosylanthranilate isomerase